MKIAALLTALLVAGFATSLAVAKTKPPKEDETTQASTSTSTTTAPVKPKCHQVELKGSATGGSVSFAVTKANK